VALVTALAVLLLAGCRAARPAGQFVWVAQYQEPPEEERGYVIAPGDLIGVRVFNQEALSGQARVRLDGSISLPFLNDVPAADTTPLALAARIRERLKAFVVNPVVTVSLEEPRPSQVTVLGQVSRPGVYRLEPRSGVLSVLALAGGLNAVADRSRLFVLRGGQSIRFTFQGLTDAEPRATAFTLRAGDVVLVE
jgi:polysaccharide export outer membrane protein